MQSFEICRVGLWSEKCSVVANHYGRTVKSQESAQGSLLCGRRGSGTGCWCSCFLLHGKISALFVVVVVSSPTFVPFSWRCPWAQRRCWQRRTRRREGDGGAARRWWTDGRTDGRRAIIGDRSRVVTARKPLGRLRNCARRPGPARAWRSLGRNLPRVYAFVIK